MLIAILNHCQLLGLLTFLYKRGVKLTELDILRFDCMQALILNLKR